MNNLLTFNGDVTAALASCFFRPYAGASTSSCTVTEVDVTTLTIATGTVPAGTTFYVMVTSVAGDVAQFVVCLPRALLPRQLVDGT